MGQVLGWTNSYPWIWTWVVVELVRPPVLLHSHYPPVGFASQLYCTTQVRCGTSSGRDEGEGQLSLTHATLNMADEGWGQLYCSHHLMAGSSATRVWAGCGDMLLSAEDSEGQGSSP